MLKAKVSLKPTKTGNVQSRVKFKVTANEPLKVAQLELSSVLVAYADVVLAEHSQLAKEEHLKEVLDIALTQIQQLENIKEGE